MSIHQYLNRQRLLRTLEELAATENLSRLALRAGFASHSHLTMSFRKEYGAAPSRMMQGGALARA